MNKKSQFEGYSDIIKNTPENCTFCRKPIEKEKEYRFEIEGKRHPFCNKKCARNYVRSLIVHYKKMVERTANILLQME